MKNLLSSLAVGVLTVMSGLYTTAEMSAKRPLNHDDFDAWESVKVDAISDNGRWSAFRVVPQEGDGTLYLRNMHKGNVITLPRGY
ncbi:MAG: hypothetical protein K2J15_05160, partial [Muribaculaceae bacterium]|nr:hypothetical protein [Muribaculaceae bacterium]